LGIAGLVGLKKVFIGPRSSKGCKKALTSTKLNEGKKKKRVPTRWWR